MQSSEIEQLQTDVTELNTKLNALIVEFNKCSDDTTTNKGKIDSLITDVAAATTLVNILRTDLQAVQLMITEDGGGTYEGDASPLNWSDDGILAKLKRIEYAIDNYLAYGPVTFDSGTLITRLTTDPTTLSVGAHEYAGTLSETSTSALGTPTSGTGDDTSVNASSSSVGGVYTTAPIKVLTLGNKPEARARKLARKTLNRLRK